MSAEDSVILLSLIDELDPYEAEPAYDDERADYFKSDTRVFADKTFADVVESALYTSQGMFGDIQFEAERELFRRLMRLYPPPAWAKGKRS